MDKLRPERGPCTDVWKDAQPAFSDPPFSTEKLPGILKTQRVLL